jgi:hypothetical protein
MTTIDGSKVDLVEEEGKNTSNKRGKSQRWLSSYMKFVYEARKRMWEKYPGSRSKEIVSSRVLVLV